ncbi:MAG: hypothetical protein ABEJ44_02945 [Halanaeroarchaeum sp.]
MYERERDDVVHVHHLSATKAIRDVGVASLPVDAVVHVLGDMRGDRVDVWSTIGTNATLASDSDADR